MSSANPVLMLRLMRSSACAGQLEVFLVLFGLAMCGTKLDGEQ